MGPGAGRQSLGAERARLPETQQSCDVKASTAGVEGQRRDRPTWQKEPSPSSNPKGKPLVLGALTCLPAPA